MSDKDNDKPILELSCTTNPQQVEPNGVLAKLKVPKHSTGKV